MRYHCYLVAGEKVYTADVEAASVEAAAVEAAGRNRQAGRWTVVQPAADLGVTAVFVVVAARVTYEATRVGP